MACNYSNKEKDRNTQNEVLFFNQGVFWPEKSKSGVYFCQPKPQTLDNKENSNFMDYRGFHN